MLEVPDFVRSVLLCILEAVNGVLCALEVPNFVCYVLLCMHVCMRRRRATGMRRVLDVCGYIQGYVCEFRRVERGVVGGIEFCP